MLNKTFQIIRIILPACILCLLIYGCREQQNKSFDVASSDSEKVFYIGIVPEQNIFRQRDRYEPLARYLSQKVGIKIELRTLVTYENIIDQIQSKNLNAVFVGSFTGAVALKKLNAQPIARPEFLDGTSAYYGLIFARKDSGINSAQDMKGKAFAFVDKATSAGWLFPLHYFKNNNIDDPSSWLDEIYYTGTHEDAILDVVNGKADIGAAKNTVFYRLADSNKKIQNQLTILATSPPFPANSLCVCPETDEALKKKLQEVLLAMHQDLEGQKVLYMFGATKFIETSEKDYEPVFNYAEALGLDLATYDNGKKL